MTNIPVIVQVDEQFCLDIMSTALESGNGSWWIIDYDITTTRDDKRNIIKITLNNPKENDEYNEPPFRNTIQAFDIAKAYGDIMSNNTGDCHTESYSINALNYDAGDADVLLQTAVFGKVVYA